MEPHGIEIIFFDAGGTLLYPEPGVGETYARHGARHGVRAAPRDLEAAFRAAFRAKKRGGAPQDRRWWREVVERTYAPFGDPADPAALFDGLSAHFADPAAWRLFPDARPALDALAARGYRLGVVSNWDDRLPGLLAGHGLSALLCPVIVSGLVGAEKPDAAIYAAACDAAGVPPRAALMVGDDPAADRDGAVAAGLAAVLLDRGGRAPGSIPDLSALPGLLPPRGRR